MDGLRYTMSYSRHQVYMELRRTHLGINNLRTEHISQEKDGFVLRVVSSGCGNIYESTPPIFPHLPIVIITV